ncbi:hypothetical protein [Angustibacter peucedani]
MDLPLFLAIALLLALLAWYLSYSAARLDRLHHRVEGARNALDAQLVRRAEAAVELATSGAVDPASGLIVADAASRAMEVGERSGTDGVHGPEAVARERAESDLSQALRATLDEHAVAELGDDPLLVPLLDRLVAACQRVQLARRFLNNAVTDATRVRRKRVVRWARLAGRAAPPETFEMDDEPPVALTR